MNKAEFVSLVAERMESSKADAEKAVNAFIASVTEVLSNGDSVTFVGFGTFKTTERKARTGRNPQTGKEIKIAAATVPSFRAGKALKDAANKKKKNKDKE